MPRIAPVDVLLVHWPRTPSYPMAGDADGFLARIREAPDDDGPRLVYADWLDEQGDPRGEFVRTQVALARLPELDPQRTELIRSENTLLVRFANEWTAPFRGLASGPVFRRGFVEEVKVTARQFLAHADALFAAGPVRHVHLLDIGSHLAAALASRHLARLTGLTIFAQHLGEPLARAVAESPHLAGLQTLHLGRNRLSDAGALRLATSAYLGNVEDLDLSENDISEVGVRALADGLRWARLRRLDLSGNTIGPAGLAAIAGSPHIPYLDQLVIASAQIGGPRLLSLPRPVGVARLATVDLAGNALRSAGLEAVFGSEPAAARDLDLSNNDLGDGAARWLATAPVAAGLRTLRLASNGITNDGVFALANSVYLSRLTALDLVNNPISDDGFRAVLESTALRYLRRLAYSAVGLTFRMRLALETRFPPESTTAW